MKSLKFVSVIMGLLSLASISAMADSCPSVATHGVCTVVMNGDEIGYGLYLNGALLKSYTNPLGWASDDGYGAAELAAEQLQAKGICTILE